MKIYSGQILYGEKLTAGSGPDRDNAKTRQTHAAALRKTFRLCGGICNSYTSDLKPFRNGFCEVL